MSESNETSDATSSGLSDWAGIAAAVTARYREVQAIEEGLHRPPILQIWTRPGEDELHEVAEARIEVGEASFPLQFDPNGYLLDVWDGARIDLTSHGVVLATPHDQREVWHEDDQWYSYAPDVVSIRPELEALTRLGRRILQARQNVEDLLNERDDLIRTSLAAKTPYALLQDVTYLSRAALDIIRRGARSRSNL